MGLRIPKPQTSDALPGTSPLNQPRSLADLESIPIPEQSQSNQASPQGEPPLVAESLPGPEPSPLTAEPARAPASGVSDEELLAAIDQPDIAEAGISDDELLNAIGAKDMSELAQNVKSKLDERGFFEKFGERFKASLGRNPKESASILAKKFGAENVKLDGDKLLFRADKRDSFQEFDPSKFSIGEFGLDIADFGGDLIEGVVGAMVELGIVVAGTAVTGGAGTLPIAAAGATVAGRLARDARGQIVEFSGGEQDPALATKEQMWIDAGFDVATLGAGKALGVLGSKVKDAVSAITEELPMRKIERLAIINQSIDDVIKETALPVSQKESAKVVEDAVTKKYDELSNTVGVFIEDAAIAMGNKRIVPQRYAANILQILKDQRVRVDPQTLRATITDKTLDLGSPNGKRALSQIVERYNRIVEKEKAFGGLDVHEIDNEAKFIRKLAQSWREGSTDLPKDGFISSKFDKLHKGIGQDRIEVVQNALQGTDSAQHIQDAFDKFRENADALNEFKRLFARGDSAEKVGEAMIQKGNSDRLVKLKNILGSDSTEWQTFKSSWLNTKMEQATSGTSGVFDAKKFYESISPNRLGREVHEQLFTESEYRRFQKAAIDFEAIGTSDIMQSNKGKLAVETIISLLSPFKNARAKGAWSLLKSNATAGDHLLNGGFVKLAQEAQSAAEKRAIMRDNAVLKMLVNNSRRAKVGNREFYVTTPAVRNALRAGLADEEMRRGVVSTATLGLSDEMLGISKEGTVMGADIPTSGDPDIDAMLEEGSF